MTQTTWLTVDDICNELRIHRATWYRWVADKEMATPNPIPGIGRLKRYSREQFQSFLKSIEGPSVGPDIIDPQNTQQEQHAA